MILSLHDDLDYPRLVFANDLIEPIAPHGYRGDVVLEHADSTTYPIYFYEAHAVAEELASRAKWKLGHFVAEPGMVILPEITEAVMKATVLELIEIGFFNHLRPNIDEPGRANGRPAPTTTISSS